MSENYHGINLVDTALRTIYTETRNSRGSISCGAIDGTDIGGFVIESSIQKAITEPKSGFRVVFDETAPALPTSLVIEAWEGRYGHVDINSYFGLRGIARATAKDKERVSDTRTVTLTEQQEVYLGLFLKNPFEGIQHAEVVLRELSDERHAFIKSFFEKLFADLPLAEKCPRNGLNNPYEDDSKCGMRTLPSSRAWRID